MTDKQRHEDGEKDGHTNRETHEVSIPERQRVTDRDYKRTSR